MKRSRTMAMALLCALLLVPLAASADSHEMGPKPLTWLSFAMSQPGKGSALGQHIAEGGAKIYDGMMADGHVLSWGVAMPINHRAGDDWNVMEWVTFRDWAAVDAFMGKFMAMQMAKSPEEMKAEQEEWYSLIEAGSHYDAIYRHQVFEVGADAGPPRYFYLGYQTAKAGQEQALTGQFKKYAMPTMSGLLADGKVNSFGLGVLEVHGGGGGNHVFWYGMPSLATLDAVSAGFEAAAKERGEEAQKAAMEEFMGSVEWGAHHDRVMVVIHSGGGGGGEGDGGN